MKKFLLAIIIWVLTICSVQAQLDPVVKSEFVFLEAPFKECHASTIALTSQGLVVSWLGGTKEKSPDVEIWVSRKENGVWTTPGSVANGVQHHGKHYPTWNPVLFQYPDDEPLKLYYNVGPDAQSWWDEVKISLNSGKNWSEARRLPEDIVGSVKNKPILLDDGRLIAPSSTENDGWKVYFEVTDDIGENWRITGPINDANRYNIIQPSVLKHSNDTLQVLARSMEGVIVSSWSFDGGESWSSPEATELPNPNSGTDAVALNDGRHLLVYNHVGKSENKWGGPRSPLNVAISDNGKTWRQVIALEEEPGEYSYPAVIQADNNLVHITYTWKRERIKHVIIDPAKINL